MSGNAKLLKEEINAAFSTAPYPGDSNIVAHNCLECAEIAATFKGTHWKDWQQRPLELRHQFDAFCLFTPAAYRFYLPAFMSICIEHYDEVEAHVPQPLVFSLGPSDPSLAEKIQDIPGMSSEQMQQLRSIASEATKKTAHSRRLERKLSTFTKQELLVILSFLKFMNAGHPDLNIDGSVDRAIEACRAFAERYGR